MIWSPKEENGSCGAGSSSFLTTVLAVIGLSLYVGWQLTHPDKKPLDESPEDYGLAYESFTLQSRLDEIRLSGWMIESPTPAKGVLVSEAILVRGNPDLVQLWVTEEASHVASYSLYPEEYSNRVVQFFNTAFSRP